MSVSVRARDPSSNRVQQILFLNIPYDIILLFNKYYSSHYFIWKVSLKMRKLTLKPDCIWDVPHRVLTHSAQSRAGTMHSIHNPGSAGLTSGGADIAISVEPGLHQDLFCCLGFIQGHLPTSAVALLPLPAMLRLLTHALQPFCGWNAQSVG